MTDQVLKSGDFVIWRKPDIGALCAYCRILDHGAWQGYWEPATLTDARAEADEVLGNRRPSPRNHSGSESGVVVSDRTVTGVD